MSYRVLLKVKLDSPSAIKRLLLLHTHLRLCQANYKPMDLDHSSGSQALWDAISTADNMMVTSTTARGYATLARSDGQSYEMSYDSDYSIGDSNFAAVDKLPPHRFFAEPGDNLVSRFYQQAHVIERLELQQLAWTAADPYRDEQGIWCPGNVRAYQADSEQQLVGSSSW